MQIFAVEYRERVEQHVLTFTRADLRVVAGAIVGSRALGPGDRWSDLDLAFGVRDASCVEAVLADVESELRRVFDALVLFDVWSGAALYRVFLLPGLLQVDVSCAPAEEFGARAPTFRLLFGAAAELPASRATPLGELHGHAAHHALRARLCIERGRFVQAEYWLHATRDLALTLACRRRGASGAYGRGYDDLPSDVHDAARAALVRDLERGELLRALGVTLDLLARESVEVDGAARAIGERLEALRK